MLDLPVKYRMSPGRISFILLLGVVLPILALYVLPQLGASQLLILFNPGAFLKIFLGILFVTLLFLSMRHFSQRGTFDLAVLVAIFWPYIAGFYHLLGHSYGIYPPLRPIMLLLVVPPAIYYLHRYWKCYTIYLPNLKYLVVFLVITFIYFIYFNSHTTYMGMAGSGSLTEGDISVSAIYAYLWPVIGSSIVAGTFFSLKPEHRLPSFDRFNQILMYVTLALSLYSIIGYPLNWTSSVVDGYLRAKGLFFHPNSYSHHLGILMVYLTGLLFYYHTLDDARISKRLLYITYSINLLAFILGFSKTAMFAWSIAACILVLTQLSNPKARNLIFPLLAFGFLLLVLSVIGFSFITNQSFLGMLQNRVEDTSSFAFRQQLWDMLIPDIDCRTIWLGHGLSSANGALQHQMFYGHRQNAVIDVHNGYLELVYNMGILGFTFILGILSMMLHCLKLMKQSVTAFSLPLLGTALCICIYYLIALGCDELLAFYPGNTLAFSLATIAVCNVHFLRKCTVL